MFIIYWEILPGVEFKLTELDLFTFYNPNEVIANIACLLILS